MPFSAIVGQEKFKKALLIVAANPTVNGVLIRGPKGVAKSTAVRALANLLSEIEVVADCPFSCDPHDRSKMCSSCKARVDSGEVLPTLKRKKRIVELPVSATLDRVVGSLDIKKVLKEGDRALEPGILAEANRGILYIDEVNLLPDEIVNAILDSASSKVNVVEREGISVTHPSDFILIGTMNPEEGELRPQLLDRFAISVDAEYPKDSHELVEIVKKVEQFEMDPDKFIREYDGPEIRLRETIERAAKLLPHVEIDDGLMNFLASTILSLSVSTRAMISAVKVAKTLAALDGRTKVNQDDIKEALDLALRHRVSDPSQIFNATTPQTGDSNRQENNNDQESGKSQPGPQDNTLQGRNSKSYNVEPMEVDLPKYNKPGMGYGRIGLFETIFGRLEGKGKQLDLYSSLVNMCIHGNRRLDVEDLALKSAWTKGSLPILILLDASKSMDFSKRIGVAKGIVKGLLKRAYQVRSKVGLIVFSDRHAKYVVPFTRNFAKINSQIDNIAPKGKTPLSSALALATSIINRERGSRNFLIPIVFLISDGKANVPLRGNLRAELSELALKIGKISSLIVIDTGHPYQPSFNQLISSVSKGIFIHVNNFNTNLDLK
ncbi:VWA domain-containing protein [Metallosphaera tengchongensis]|uniref:VWA domain-containing protein n=2 Tax=Metallosphaera tengchongensis TaxID=1532350 RepID=A0A6N0NVS0_9CREN|nr:VWA domain-containing protein [Metallosphaera tengchongensis]